MRCFLLRTLAVPTRGARPTCARQEGEVPSEKGGVGRSLTAPFGNYPSLIFASHWSIQQQQVSPHVICHAKPIFQAGFPESPRRDEYPRKRERAFPNPFTSSLPLALLGCSALTATATASIQRVPAAVRAQHRRCRGWH